MRVAIYARMSTDKQSDTSPDDQVARCREYAEGQGWSVVEDLVIMERGISGASRHNRPGLLGLIASIDEWDVLVAYDFARLTNNVRFVDNERNIDAEAIPLPDTSLSGAGIAATPEETPY